MFFKGGFVLASLIYILNSFANVSQGVLIKYYQSSLSMGLYEIIALKCFISIIIMLPFSLKYLKNFKHNFLIVLLLAFLYSCDLLLCNTGFKTVPINTGTLILLLIPLWVIILGRFILKEKSFNIINALALLVCLFAIFLTVKDEISFTGFNIGYIYLFAASIVIPLGLILQKKFSDTRPVAYALFTNAVVLMIISIILSGINNHQDFKLMPTFNVDWIKNINFEQLKGCFFIALCDLTEFAAVYIAYQLTEPALLQPIRFTRILFSIGISYILLSEKPTKYQIIAAILIIISNIFSIIYSKKKQNNM